MLFWIKIDVDRKTYTLKVERTAHDEMHEIFKISGRNKTITLQTDRPFWRNKGVRHRKPTVELVEGTGHNMAALEKIKEALLQALE